MRSTLPSYPVCQPAKFFCAPRPRGRPDAETLTLTVTVTVTVTLALALALALALTLTLETLANKILTPVGSGAGASLVSGEKNINMFLFNISNLNF